MKAVEVTGTSWVLYDDYENKVGVLVKKIKAFQLFKADKIENFDTQKELEEEYGKIKFKDRQVKENTNVTVAGLPVDEDDVFNIDEESEIPCYTKTPTSKARYAPGYWGIKFSAQYVGVFCPKVSTLQSYKYIGPFKDKFTRNSEIAATNKRLNDEMFNEQQSDD